MELCRNVKKYPLNKADSAKLRAHLAAARPRTSFEAVDALEGYSGSLKGDNKGCAMSLSFASAIRDVLETETVAETIEQIGSKFSGLAKDYGRAQEDIFFSDPPFFYLAQFANRYGDDFESFVDDIQMAVDTLAQLPADEEGSTDVWTRPVHLMTALRAKGKEFDTVVLLDVNDGIWPSRWSETQADKEQERRVFYVAMTRAKKRLVCTVSGQIGNAPAVPSPFLSEAGLI
jgi:DNA helicase-2/ATP-dependent DNA helicase PcrA